MRFKTTSIQAENPLLERRSQLSKKLLQKNNRLIKHAIETKDIKCDSIEKSVKIRVCDYGEKKVCVVLSGILFGIRNKKKLLKLIRKSGF